MKLFPVLVCVLLGTASTVRAAVILSQTFSGGTIPEGDPVGALFTGTFDQAASAQLIQSLTVDVNITGGYDGDLYASLMAPNGTITQLFNEPGLTVNGFGAGGAGMNVTFSDIATQSIQLTTSPDFLTGTYQPAGVLGNMDNSAANGTWEIFFASLGTGGGDATLNDWALDISTVPEPVYPALGIFGTCFLAGTSLRRWWRTKRA